MRSAAWPARATAMAIARMGTAIRATAIATRTTATLIRATATATRAMVTPIRRTATIRTAAAGNDIEPKKEPPGNRGLFSWRVADFENSSLSDQRISGGPASQDRRG